MTDQATSQNQSSGLLAALVPMVEGWRLLFTSALLLSLLAVAAILYRGPRYRAEMSLVSVANPKMTGLGGSAVGLAAAASLLGGASGSLGLQSSPALIVKIADLDGVLASIAMSPVTPGSRELVIERLTEKPLAEIPDNKIQAIMRKYIRSNYDRGTGIIQIGAVHKDSAIARVVASRVVERTRLTFLNAVRAQAAELRKAQEQRVAVAQGELGRAEAAMQQFLRGNRQVPDFSEASIQKQRLQRDVTRASELLGNAMSDQESARSKELEDSPAVVVIDPLPQRLPRTPRYLAAITVLSGFLGALCAAVFLLAKHSFLSRVAQGDPSSLRLASKLRRFPGFRGLTAAPRSVSDLAADSFSAPALTRTGTGPRL